MNINKRTIIFISILFIISMLVFLLTKNYFPTTSNIFIAIFTSAFIVICTSLINYWHEKETFLNNLFFTGLYLNSSMEQIRQLIVHLDENSDLKKVEQKLSMHSNIIKNIITTTNFAQYSPFWENSKEAKLVTKIHSLYLQIEQTILPQITYITIAKNEIEIIELKQQKIIHPCACCNILPESRPNPQDCQNLKIYNDNITLLQGKLLQQKTYTNNLIKSLYSLIDNIQIDYIRTMDNIHSISKNKVRWDEALTANKENISKTIPEFVKNQICKDDDAL